MTNKEAIENLKKNWDEMAKKATAAANKAVQLRRDKKEAEE